MTILPEYPQLDLLKNLLQTSQETNGSQPDLTHFQKMLNLTLDKLNRQGQGNTDQAQAEQELPGDETGGLPVGEGKETVPVTTGRDEKPRQEEGEETNPLAGAAVAQPQIAPVQDPNSDTTLQEGIQRLMQAMLDEETIRQGNQGVVPERQAAIPLEGEEGIPILSTELTTDDAIPQTLPLQLTQEDSSKFESLLSQALEQLEQVGAAQAENTEETEALPEIEGEAEVEAVPQEDPELPTGQQQGSAEDEGSAGQESKSQGQTQTNTPIRMDDNPLKDEVRKATDAVLSMGQSAAVEQPQPREPVTTAQTSQPAQQPQNPFPASDQMEQVRVQVQENLENQRMEFQMQLQPKELGEVSVKMVMESGRLAVEIIAANPRAAELLSKSAEGLIASLRGNSIQLDSVQIVTGSHEASGQMRGAFNMDHSNGSEQQDEQSGGGHGRQAYSGGSAEEEEPEAGPQTILDYQV